MDFGLTQPQELLRDSIARFLAQDVGVERVRRVMDSESGRDEAIHGQLGDQGITGLLVDMDLGGSELRLCRRPRIAAQEIGRAARAGQLPLVLRPGAAADRGRRRQRAPERAA